MKTIQFTLILMLSSVAVLLPTNAMAQSSGVEIWSQRCSLCHTIQPANRYNTKDWTSIMGHMELNARLTTKQAEKILDFLNSGARKLAIADTKGTEGLTVASSEGTFIPDPVGGEEVYEANCVPCHGKSGKGDGPAAVAFDPPPVDFSVADGVKTQPIEDVVGSITAGNAGMPAFGATLSTEEIEAVAEYIRSF